MSDDSISLEAALERCDGRGSHARKVLIAGCSACYCAGMSGAVAPFLMEEDGIPDEGNYSKWATSMLASAIFAGMWVGSVVGGLACDAIGPGRVICGCLVLLAVAGVAPALSTPIAIPARFVCGMALCAVYQATNTYVAEWVVTRRRSTYLSMLHIGIATGGLTTTTIAIILQWQSASWRLLLILNSCPPLLVLFGASRFLLAHEAPRWLLVSGKPGACDRLLRRIALRQGGLALRDGATSSSSGSSNYSSDESSSFQLPKISLQLDHGKAEVGEVEVEMSPAAAASSTSSPATLSSRRFSFRSRLYELLALWRLHAFGCALAFCLNFGSKGTEIWMGTFVESKDLKSLSRVIYLCTITGKITGDFINMRASKEFGRLRCLQAGFVVCSIATLLLVVPMPTKVSSGAWLLCNAFLQGASMDLLWCNLYIYLVERFPTTVRSTGFGVAMGIGRSGGIVSSAIGNLMPSMTEAFVFYGCAFGVGALVALLIRQPETSKRSLVDAST